jgi:NAD(P)-dependent dehydrogenase (short-subunit alcohol dehydrogenase family)
MRSLEGQVALVTGGGTGLGRAVALALAARGVRIVVTGREERALGETVGEIAHAGGKARHVAGDPREASHLDSAVARALDVFGGLDVVVDASGEQAAGRLLDALRSPGRLVLTSPTPAGVVRELAAAGSERAITCNAVLLGAGDVDELEMQLAEVVVLLCRSEADRITGQTLTLGGGPR